MGRAEKGCPICYHKLPRPGEVLEPYDEELNYFMWIPGFEWKPKPVPEEDAYGSEHSESEGQLPEPLSLSLRVNWSQTCGLRSPFAATQGAFVFGGIAGTLRAL